MTQPVSVVAQEFRQCREATDSLLERLHAEVVRLREDLSREDAPATEGPQQGPQARPGR